MKTLVDEIRDMVTECRRGHGNAFICPTDTDAAKDLLGRRCWSEEDEADLFTKIAERIEREYMELPVLEGEPLRVGDKVDGYNQTGAKVEAVMNDKMVVVRSTVKGGGGYHDGAYPLLLWAVDDLKRNVPDVLDADGVPIKVGDTVWRTDEINGKSRIVKGFREYGDVITDYDGTIPVCANPKHLTHKQPDTLERIEEDARKSIGTYWGCMDVVDCDDCPSRIDGETPYKHYGAGHCGHAITCDLLRRQREVLERGKA